MNINIQRLPHAADLPLPAYATTGSAGLDLHAAIPTDLIIGSGVIIKTLLAIIRIVTKRKERTTSTSALKEY